MSNKRATVRGYQPCGCHIESDRIVYCVFHGKTKQMINVLNTLRQYFIDTTGEESPFVQKIDEIIPRFDEK